MSEQTEKPTEYKLQKAKEKGQVSKSNELTCCCSLLIMLAVVTALWPSQLQQIKQMIYAVLVHSTQFHFSVDSICQLHYIVLEQLVSWWLPFAGFSIITIILSTLAQTGIVWSFTALVPDFKRLHWGQGLKKLCSLKTCFEALKSSFKLMLSTVLLFFVLKTELVSILQLSLINPNLYPPLMMHFILKLLFKLLILLTLIALLDKYYTLKAFQKGQSMSKQEIKEEYKQKEGDPKIKSKIRQLQQQLRQKTASLQEVRTADVLITNPTHLAIALKYDRKTMPAPKVVCKAEGELALSVKKLASKYRIPIIEHKTFARALYHSIHLNQWISPDLFPIAASIFKNIYLQRGAE